MHRVCLLVTTIAYAFALAVSTDITFNELNDIFTSTQTLTLTSKTGGTLVCPSGTILWGIYYALSDSDAGADCVLETSGHCTTGATSCTASTSCQSVDRVYIMIQCSQTALPDMFYTASGIGNGKDGNAVSASCGIMFTNIVFGFTFEYGKSIDDCRTQFALCEQGETTCSISPACAGGGEGSLLFAVALCAEPKYAEAFASAPDKGVALSDSSSGARVPASCPSGTKVLTGLTAAFETPMDGFTIMNDRTGMCTYGTGGCAIEAAEELDSRLFFAAVLCAQRPVEIIPTLAPTTVSPTLSPNTATPTASLVPTPSSTALPDSSTVAPSTAITTPSDGVSNGMSITVAGLIVAAVGGAFSILGMCVVLGSRQRRQGKLASPPNAPTHKRMDDAESMGSVGLPRIPTAGGSLASGGSFASMGSFASGGSNASAGSLVPPPGLRPTKTILKVPNQSLPPTDENLESARGTLKPVPKSSPSRSLSSVLSFVQGRSLSSVSGVSFDELESDNPRAGEAPSLPPRSGNPKDVRQTLQHLV